MQKSAFDQWFGSSVIREADGQPMRMYHGTYAPDVGVFDRLKAGWRGQSIDMVGSWFSSTPGPAGAGKYADSVGAAIYPVYLAIQRPRYYDSFRELLQAMHEANGVEYRPGMNGKGSPEALREKLTLQGYDGIVLAQTNVGELNQELDQLMRAVRRAKDEEYAAPRHERHIYMAKRERIEESAARLREEVRFYEGSTEFDGQTVAIAFHPEQIKSALGNDGSYSPQNPDIRRSLQAAQEAGFPWQVGGYATVGSMKASIAELVGLDAMELQASVGSIVVTTSEDLEQQREDAFRRWFGESAVVDAAGDPLVLYHSGSFDEAVDAVPTVGASGFHFGTLTAAQERVRGKFVDDQVAEAEIYEEDGRFYVDGEWPTQPAFGFGTEADARSWIGGEVNQWDIELEEGQMTQVFLSISNPKRVVDQGSDWAAVIAQAKEEGHDGIVYRNAYEDKGSLSYIAFEPAQIKSVRNTGSFDPRDPRVTHSLAEQARAGKQAAFDRWFGASKVVAPDGKPLVVYHGTNTDFTVFRPSGDDSSLGAGIYLTSDASSASDYAVDNAEFRDGPPSVMPLFVQMASPIIASSEDELLEAIGKLTPATHWDEVRRDLEAAGVDGLWQRYPGGGDQIVVFRPEQIKSAIGNRGTYDPRNSDIRFSLSEDGSDGAFVRWFDGSAVVDERGAPLIVYHGTTAEFSVFNMDVNRDDFGIFTTPNPALTASYADGPDGRVMPLHLAIKNPYVMDHDERVMWQMEPSAYHEGGMQGFIADLKRDGFDGIKVEGRRLTAAELSDDADEQFNDLWIPFRPEQIKSAIGNCGTYDPRDPDIRYSMGESPRGSAFDRWFEGSQIVDGRGEPLVVYRGDAKGLSVFNGERHGSRVQGSIFFASSPYVARGYTPGAWRENKLKCSDELVESDGLYRAYLSILNPLLVDAGGANWSAVPNPFARPGSSECIQIDDLAALAKEAGYDGLIVKDVWDQFGDSDQYVAFRPEQIKSATGNRGTYDPADPDIRHSLGTDQDIGPRAQAWHDASSNTTVFLADRIPAGREAAVFLHETVHRHGRSVLPEHTFDQLVGQVHTWAQRSAGTVEREIYGAAARRVARARVSGPAADEELFAYAVEEAVARGVQPSAAAAAGSAQAWLQAVVESIQRIGEKLVGNALQGLDGQDLVDLAYALAQLDRPEHAPVVEQALQEALQGAVPAPQQGRVEDSAEIASGAAGAPAIGY